MQKLEKERVQQSEFQLLHHKQIRPKKENTILINVTLN